MAHDRAFVVSLGFSVLFHLSMVTVFSIVIFFPREAIHYYSFQIIEPPSQRPSVAAQGDRSQAPSLGDVSTNGALHLSGGSDPWGVLPEIELPTIEFAELRRLRVREKGLALRARHESLLAPKPRDAWARFGEELGQLGSALSRLRLSGGKAPPEEPPPAPITRPAAGFEAYIEWMGEPRDRELLFAPPIEALWGVSPGVLDKPIVLEFAVSAQGRVLSVWSPLVDEGGLITSAQNTLLKYRFEPVEGNRTQQATLHIMAARTRQ